MLKDQLERRGYRPNPAHIKELNVRGKKVTTSIVGRRAKKEWRCSDEHCGKCIEWDDVYVQVTDPYDYRGPQSVPQDRRYHIPCAIAQGLLIQVSTVNASTDRRAAVAMSKLKNENL